MKRHIPKTLALVLSMVMLVVGLPITSLAASDNAKSNFAYGAGTFLLEDWTATNNTPSLSTSGYLKLSQDNNQKYATVTYKDTYDMSNGFELNYSAKGRKSFNNIYEGSYYVGVKIGNLTLAMDQYVKPTIMIDGTVKAKGNAIITYSANADIANWLSNTELNYGSVNYTVTYDGITVTYAKYHDSTKVFSLTYTDTEGLINVSNAAIALYHNNSYGFNATYYSIDLAVEPGIPDLTGMPGGACGDNATWAFDETTGILYIVGEGETYNFGNSGNAVAPWRVYSDVVTKVVIDNSITYLGNRAFKNMTSLTTVKFGAGVRSTGYECFQGCTALASVELNDVITKLGSNLFYGCSSLETINIPESVTTINTRVFKNCTKLNNVVLPEALSNSSYEVFMGCTSLESINIPAKYTIVAPAMFSGCTSLKEVYIPKTVTKIRVQAFMNCTALESVTFEDEDTLFGGSDARISSNAFEGCSDKLTLKSCMAGYVSEYANARGIKFESTTSTVFIYTVDAEGNATVTGMRGTTSIITIPETIDGHTVVAVGGFRYNTATRVNLPTTVTAINSRAFQDCVNLTKVTGLDNVTKISSNAFNGCSALTNITFGSGLTSISTSSFQNCTALGEIYVPNTVTSVNNTAFTGCTNAVIKTQANSAAAKAAAAQGVTVKVVTDFDYTVNEDGESVTITGYYGNGGALVIPDEINGYKVTAINQRAFKGNTSITSVVIGNTVTNIKYEAFMNCTNITNITVGTGVTAVGASSFGGLTKLETITFEGSGITFNANALLNSTSRLVICGVVGSSTETFAIEKGFTFANKDTYDPTAPKTIPFSKGLNITGMETFLSDNQWNFFEDGYSVVSDPFTYSNIKSKGFDYVRIPVNFYTVYYEAPTGNYKYTSEQIMQAVDKGIQYAFDNDLYVMLDFHGWFYIGSEADDYEQFLYCWTQVAERYKDYSDKLCFELLNEPWYTNGAPQKYLWDSKLNDMQCEAIDIIRNTGSNNTTRLIVCCTADGNKAWKLDKLNLPTDDKYLAVAIHEYEPHAFTHQNFSWAGLGGQTTSLSAAGGFSAINYDFSMIKSFMEETGIPVILNEFGMNLAKASDEDVTTYLSGITKLCKDNNMPWAYWGYHSTDYNSEGGMALYRKNSYWGSKTWDQTALDALFSNYQD